jgi:hypothetical protein
VAPVFRQARCLQRERNRNASTAFCPSTTVIVDAPGMSWPRTIVDNPTAQLGNAIGEHDLDVRQRLSACPERDRPVRHVGAVHADFLQRKAWWCASGLQATWAAQTRQFERPVPVNLGARFTAESEEFVSLSLYITQETGIGSSTQPTGA